jgi:DNA-binding NtrC family response regulator
VRVVTATNKDLLALSHQGKFREDLYYRLSTLPINVPALRERPSDIPILFKKFAADFAEKYHIRDIELTPDAEIVLTNYRWPGNIRQLKNIVEQMSVLEQDRIINEQVLTKYLPREQTGNQLIFAGENRQQEGLNEREIFYKVLYDLKRDMNDLKGIVLGLLENQQNNNPEFVETNKAALTRILPVNDETSFNTTQEVMIRPKAATIYPDEITSNAINIEPSVMVNTDENLSLGAKEEEMIKKALLKNNGKRKKAATELGISERTLYRKIKEFGLE